MNAFHKASGDGFLDFSAQREDETSFQPRPGYTPHDIIGEPPTASQELTELMGRIGLGGPIVAAVRLTFEGLDEIRDSLGVQATEWVLRIVAQRLSGLIGVGTLAARLGADEFLVLACVSAPIDAQQLAFDIEVMAGIPVSVRGCDLILPSTLEVSLLPVEEPMSRSPIDDTLQPLAAGEA